MMKVDRQLLEEQINAALTNYEAQRKVNRRRSANVAVINASMAAVTTVLIGLANAWQPATRILSSLAIVTSALVMVISGWDRIYNHKRLWMIYTDAWVKIRELKSDLAHLDRTAPNDDEAVALLYSRFKSVMKGLNEQWMAMKSEDKG